jgi:hypothetical protein
MAAPEFTDLQLNGRPPIVPFSDRQVLSTQSGTILEPSRVLHDGFHFTTPQGAPRQYLVDAFHFDTQLLRFDVDLLRWGGLGDAARGNALTRIELAYSAWRSTMLLQHWPVRARTEVAAVAKEVSSCIQALRGSPPDDEGVSHAWVGAADALRVAVDGLRASIGLPPAA